MTDLEKVRQNGYVIRNIKNPSMEVQMAAVRYNGHAIAVIENPSLEIQRAAEEAKAR